MSSNDSDDEPLALIAQAKKLNPENVLSDPIRNSPPKKKRKPPPRKKTDDYSEEDSDSMQTKIIQRPTDVWLYLKDLNPAGPYSCLLCTEWFMNRTKLVVHYVLNHKKDFCGICRYFVADRNTWLVHMAFHCPWYCSECSDSFQDQGELTKHLSDAHEMAYCRLCYFRVRDDDIYSSHLFQKHSVTNVDCKDKELLWELLCDGTTNFLCLLCSKTDLPSNNFFRHFIGFHRLTMKAFAELMSGRDTPFTVSGVDVSTNFVETELKHRKHFGYADVGLKDLALVKQTTQIAETILQTITPVIKEETLSDTEEGQDDVDEKEEQNDEKDIDNSDEKETEQIDDKDKEMMAYKGHQDFDVTQMELVTLPQCYYQYITQTLLSIQINSIPVLSDIDYQKASDVIQEMTCGLCQTTVSSLQEMLNHMHKKHVVKSLNMYMCRVCGKSFETHGELVNHCKDEMGNFEDLWICQFCDKEFNNRVATRGHLTEHWDVLETDNCFSPHLGFKCNYCPVLFWNETDREAHQLETHYEDYKKNFYKCDMCPQMFSDKVWFVYHYIETHFPTVFERPFYLLKCCICCEILRTIDEMRTHFLKNHPDEKKLFCSKGNCKFRPLSHWKSFRIHLKNVHCNKPDIEAPVPCDQCGREFATTRSCISHKTQAHGGGKLACKICGDTMHTMDERKLHYLFQHPGEHPYRCECGKSFQHKSSLYMHRQEHAITKPTFTCAQCNKTFAKKDSYREHILIHESPRHACAYCPMRFVQRSNMLRHERRHTGERPYSCPSCPRTFADRGACTSHMRTHSKDKNFACIYCGQTFVQKSKLTYHIRRHTGENLQTCPVCSKLFTSSWSLREHMKCHERRSEELKCIVCGKYYNDARSLQRHRQHYHSVGESYPCPLCDKVCNNKFTLQHHVLTHSKYSPYTCKLCKKAYATIHTTRKHLRKRHSLNNMDRLTEYYIKRDPRDCGLGLDDATLNKLFGRKRDIVNTTLIGDFITFTKEVKMAPEVQHVEGNDNDSLSEGDEVLPDSEIEDYEGDVDKKDANSDVDDEEREVQPTDFVSVKIECAEESEVEV